MTRANGHFQYFYSVAQHSINCYKEAKLRNYSEAVQVGCLLHDASESYISDITRPVKKNLSQYFLIEEKIQRIIYEKYALEDLSDEDLDRIKDVDDAMIYYEFIELMDEKIFDEVPYIAMKHNFSQEDFLDVENQFIHAYEVLTKKTTGNNFVGIDGCKGGYVAVNITEYGFNVEVFKSIKEICLKYSDSNCIMIDMPIGLPETENDIRPDGYARKILSSRASCVFNDPCRQAVYEEDYSKANKINKKVLGKGLSKQSFAISKKIRDLDEFLCTALEWKNKLIESHPEVCFTMLNFNGVFSAPIYENKKTPEGMEKRLKVLSKYYDKTDEIKELIYSNPGLKAFKDDIIDALCLAVTGRIGFKNGFKTIPEMPMKDSRGILMQMVYAFNM
jgi:predicted RNase H-like nuclease